MNLLELSALMQDENKCEEYQRNVGILKHFTKCLKCNSTKIRRVRRHRWKCYDCNYEWHIRRNIEIEKPLDTSGYKFSANITYLITFP